MRNYFKRVLKGLPWMLALVCVVATAAGLVCSFLYVAGHWPLPTFLVAGTALIVHLAWVFGD
jgi:RsiW-degrading membrane proteinase PrsW (M82 family)